MGWLRITQAKSSNTYRFSDKILERSGEADIHRMIILKCLVETGQEAVYWISLARDVNQ
jgi:hypothetical protein